VFPNGVPPMKRSLSFAGLLLGLCAVTGVALAGHDGSRESHGAPAPAGSGTFRPPPPARSAPSFSRPSNPVTEHFERPSVVEERHAPPVASSASVLPSVNAPNHARTVTEFHAPPPSAPARTEPKEDFLGMHGEERTVRPVAPTHFAPTTLPSTVTHPTVLTPFKPATGPARFSSLPDPGGKPARGLRPALAPRWQAASGKYSNQFSHWSQTNSPRIAAFQASRAARWNQIALHRTGASWRGQFHTPQYRQWRHDFWDFRRSRAEEIWLATQGLYGSLFDDYWWSSCWWRHRPWSVAADFPPWWWWSTPGWADEVAFFGPDLGAGPIPYDPGTNVFYDGNTYDVDGNDDGSAADAGQQVIDLSNVPVDDYPVPEPAPEGQPQEWLPLGAWALTQQEQGDAVMYFQLSVDRNGVIGGGYKNALTGDEQPVVGRLDKRSQRLAWHIANNTQTVFETGLSSLNYDVAGVFVHFGPNQTQNWMMVRLPSPDLPPGPATIPPDTN